MFKLFPLIRIYALLATLVLGLFIWAGLSGTWLLGDDLESVEKVDGKGFHRSSGGRFRSGRSSFYHK